MENAPKIYNYQGVINEDYNVANTRAPPELQTPTPAMVHQSDVLGDDEDEPLNENDDDDDLDDVDEDEELNTQHLVLAQFDKVTRAKNRWKCTLKDGVMHVNNIDILFNKILGLEECVDTIVGDEMVRYFWRTKKASHNRGNDGWTSKSIVHGRNINWIEQFNNFSNSEFD